MFPSNSGTFEPPPSPPEEKGGRPVPSRGPTVTVLIPTYQRGTHLVATLRQVLAQEPPADEVLVVDQTPHYPPAIEQELRSLAAGGRVRRLRQSRPSLPAARNRGLAAATSEVVLHVDDDVVLPPGFVAAHRRNYADPAVAGVAGRVLSPLTPADAAERPVHRPGGARFDCLYFRLDGRHRVAGVANWIGANFSARRRALLAIGGHDESYVGTVCDEVDTAVRLWQAGQLIVYDPEAWLEHLLAPAGGLGGRSRDLTSWRRYFGTHYFLRRHVFPHWRYWLHLLRYSRSAVLHRGNLRRPWVLPWAGVSYLYALARALGTRPRLPLEAKP